jgi:hypothetical protein
VKRSATGICRRCMSAMYYDQATGQWRPVYPEPANGLCPMDARRATGGTVPHLPIIAVHKLTVGDVFKLDDDVEPQRIRGVVKARGDEATHLRLALESPNGVIVTATVHRQMHVIPLAPEPVRAVA